MTDIDGVHKWIDFISDKVKGQFFTGPEKDAALHRGQMAYFNALYAESFLSEKIHDALSPFKSTYPFLTTDTPAGLLSLPAGYQYLTGGHVIVVNDGVTAYRKIEIYSEGEISDRLNDQIKPVSVNKPVATLAVRSSSITKFQLYPKTPMAGELFYLTEPLPPVWATTQEGRTIAYDPDSSTQLLWNETALNDVMMRALEFLGISTPDEVLTQYANAKQKEIQ